MDIIISERTFKVSKQLVNGLYFTNDSVLVSSNMDLFNIVFESSQAKNKVQSDVCKRDDYAIITIKFTEKLISQYLISNQLNVSKIDSLSEDIIPKQFKKIIHNAFQLTQKPKTLGDFFKK